MTTRGFFCMAQGDAYVRMAYALALSLKASQSKVNKLAIGITPGYKVPEKYINAFDRIIEIPWSDLAAYEVWKLRNEWKARFMSPYDETIKLDADMLFFDDISDWWDELSKSSIVFATNAVTYRDDVVTSDYYRKTFTLNELPNVYSAFMFFNKDAVVYEFFTLAELIFERWDLFATELLDAKHRPIDPTTDVVYAMASKILNLGELNNNVVKQFPIFTHMKTQLQGWKDSESLSEDWTKNIRYHFTSDCKLRINNFEQHVPFHYHVKEFLTDEILNFLEAKVNGSH